MVESLEHEPIVGTCLQMCPEPEIERRVKTNRLHRLEATRQSLATRILEPDRNRAVKEFERTAMGSLKIDCSRIRPVAVLEKTVSYLIDEILPVKSLPFNQIYDFVFDRFRAVRQEMVMQQIEGDPKIRILEKMVLFHVYSAFRMVEMQYRCFDPVINRQHLSECLNILMTQYDSHQTGRADLTEESISRRAVFEAIFLMHNFLYDHAIVRFGSIPASVSANETAAQAFRMAAAFRTGNFFRVLAALPLLPVFSLMALAPHIPAIQLNYARILSSAFAPPAPPVSLKYLTRILCPFEKHAVAAEYVSCLCQQFDAKIDQSIVRFHKSNKDSAATANILRTIPQRAWSLLDKRLANDSIRDLINFTCPDDP